MHGMNIKIMYIDNSWSRLQEREMHSAYKIYLFDSQKLC